MEISFENYSNLKAAKLKRAEIAEKFGITENKLKKLISVNSWGTTAPSILNESLFSSYTRTSCYWAGFLAADGCVSDKGKLSICLNYDDTGHIEKFREVLKSNHAITSNTTKYYRSEISFINKKIAEDLKNNFNIVPRKTNIYCPPNNMPEEFIRHFIRGYFDGDGCICESFSNKNSKTATLYTTIIGTLETVQFIQRVLELNCSIQQHQTNKNIFTIKYCTNHSKKFLSYIYEDCEDYLERKYKLFKEIVVNNVRTHR